MAEAIRVLVVDDCPVVRTGLISILGAAADIDVVGEAGDYPEAIRKALELRPDVVLIDIFMRGCTGLEAMVTMREDFPGAKVVIFTASEQEENVRQALRLGAEGYLLKSSTLEEVVDAVRLIAAGEVMLSQHTVTLLVAEFRNRENGTNHESEISSRQMEVLQLVGECLTNTEVGHRLFISESTVRTHLRRLMDALHLRNRAEVVAYASNHHLTSNSRLLPN